MARYQATYLGERRTQSLRAWVTPTERQALEEEAKAEGAGLSEYVRQLCVRRLGGPTVVAGTRRNPDAKALAEQLHAIGNNLNQLTRVANQTGELRREAELDGTIDVLKAALSRVIAL